MEIKPNPNPELTKKVLNYWRNGVGRAEYVKVIPDFHPTRRIISLEVDNHKDIAPTLRDQTDYFRNCDFEENVPFIIVKNGHAGLQVNDGENKIPEIVEAPELWIPGAYIRDDNARSFIQGFVDSCGLEEVCGLEDPIYSPKKMLTAGSLYGAQDDRVKGRCRDGHEMSMCFYSYVVGIIFFPKDDDTLRSVEERTLRTINYRALEEKLRQTDAYRAVKGLERECMEAGRLVAETIINPVNEESKIRKSFYGFIGDYLKSLVKFLVNARPV